MTGFNPGHRRSGVAQEFTFTMTHRQVYSLVDPAGKYAGRERINLQVGPAILKAAAVVMGQRRRLLQVLAVKSGEHPHLDHQLETVTDPEDQLAVSDKAAELVNQLFISAGDCGILQAVGLGFGAPQIVAVEKTAGHVEKMKVIQTDLAGKYLGDMGDNGLIETTEAAGMSSLHLAVGSVAGYDDCTGRFHCFKFSLNDFTISLSVCAALPCFSRSRRNSRLWPIETRRRICAACVHRLR